MHTVTVRLTATELALLDEIVLFKHANSRSDALRSLISGAITAPALKPAAADRLHAEQRQRRRRRIR